MDAKLFSVADGYFSVPNGVVVVRAPFATGITLVDLRENPELLRAELIRRHEFAHYRQLNSTPFGLLLWRAYNSLLSDVDFICGAVADLEPAPYFSLPIDQWVAGPGLTKALQDGAVFRKDRISIVWNDLGRMKDYVRNLGGQIGELRKFLDAILNRSAMTIGEFVEIANAALDEMGRRSDLRPTKKWTTNLSDDTPLYTCDRFSGTEMIEAAARLVERQLIEQITDAPSYLADWEKSQIHGVYAPAYRWLMSEVGSVEAAIGLLDVAFMTPIDMAFFDAVEGELLVEDVLPAFRLPRLVEVAANRFWPEAGAELDDFLGASLCDAAGLIRPERISEIGSTATFSGQKSWGADHRLLNLNSNNNPALIQDYLQEQVRRAMTLRKESPSSLLQENHLDEYLFRPLIIFYNDRVVFGIHELEKKKDGLRLCINAFIKFAQDGALSTSLGAGNQAELHRLQKLMLARAFPADANDDWFARSFQLRSISSEQKRNLFSMFDIQGYAKFRLGYLANSFEPLPAIQLHNRTSTPKPNA